MKFAYKWDFEIQWNRQIVQFAGARRTTPETQAPFAEGNLRTWPLPDKKYEKRWNNPPWNTGKLMFALSRSPFAIWRNFQIPLECTLLRFEPLARKVLPLCNLIETVPFPDPGNGRTRGDGSCLCEGNELSWVLLLAHGWKKAGKFALVETKMALSYLEEEWVWEKGGRNVKLEILKCD